MAVTSSPLDRRSLHGPHSPLLKKTITNLEDIDSDGLLSSMDTPRWRQLAREVRYADELPQRRKAELLNGLARRFLALFGSGVTGKPYRQLKSEAVFLAELTRRSLVHMALRLMEIHDHQLYREDGYSDFRSFVELELPVSRSTVYNYIDIVRYFGLQAISEDEDLEYSKLLPVIPLLRESGHSVPHDQIRAHFLHIAAFRSKREIEREARALRRRYGLDVPSPSHRAIAPEHILSLVQENIPSHPTQHERQVLERILAVILRTLDDRA